MILVSLVLFFVGALVAGVANNFSQILIGRCIQGVGGGSIAVLAEIVVTDLVPLRLRGNYYGILSAMYSLGSVLGPILGGGFSENVTWVFSLDSLSSILYHSNLTQIALDILY